MQEIRDFEAQVAGFEDLQKVYSAFDEFIKPYGFDAFTFGFAPLRRGKVDSTGADMYSTMPAPASEEYREKQMESFDPVFELMATRYLPYTKSSIEPIFEASPQKQSIKEYADDHQMGDALMIPLSTADYCRGAVLFTRESPADFERRIVQDGPLLRYAAAVAMLRAEQLGYGQAAKTEPILSARETECLQICAQGKTNDEIAAALGVSERTVRFHLKNAGDKLGCQRRSQAVTRAIQLGLIRT
ncbi:MAG: LuxR C-terminal-related transcriptional regulator [Planctomycetota bacterium]